MPPKKGRKKRPVKNKKSEVEGLCPDAATWKGWCEIESEPAFFNVMLEEMGVRGIKMQEVFSLDDDMLAILPKPVHALIFLFRYQIGTEEQCEESCPPHLWFAEQIPDNACATVALLNIVNNIPALELGQELRSFRDFTNDMNPRQRGETIDGFHFVKTIHNSFARELDMLDADLALKRKQDKASKTAPKRRKLSDEDVKDQKVDDRSPSTPMSDKDFDGDEKGPDSIQSEPAGLRRSGRKLKPVVKLGSVTCDERSQKKAAGVVNSEGFHFIAYMPVQDEVWRLDGMDPFPQKLGDVDAGVDWMDLVRPALVDRMARYSEGDIEFNLIAVVQDPIIAARNDLSKNIKSIVAIDEVLSNKDVDSASALVKHANARGSDGDRTNGDTTHDDATNDEITNGVATSGTEAGTELLTAMSIDYSISQADIKDASLPQTIIELLSSTTEELEHARADLATNQAGCRAAVRDQLHAKEADKEYARLRRHDYRPFLKAWVETLKEADMLDTLSAMVKAKV